MPTALDPVRVVLAFFLLLLFSALTNFDSVDRTSARWRFQTINTYAFALLMLGEAGATLADRSSALMILTRYLGIVGIAIAAGGLLRLRWKAHSSHAPVSE
jgi:hypothetical protein